MRFEPERGRETLDLRLAPSAIACWGTAALGLGWSPSRAVAAAALLWVGGVVVLGWGPRAAAGARLPVVAVLVVAGAAMAAAALRVDAVRAGPLSGLATQGASVHLSGRVASDPVRREGSFAPYVLVTLTVSEVTSRGVSTRVRSPVLVIGDLSWFEVAYGERVDAFGHLQEPDGADLAAVLIAAGPPVVTGRSSWLQRRIAQVRGGLREAAEPLAPPRRALLPALVDGDVSAMPEETTADFKTTGLTHLLAVSGSNLTLVLGFVLFVARWSRVRGYGLGVVGAVAVVLFVLLARPQPSVLRAAAMGLVALAGLATGSRARGVRVLCVAIVGLVVLDPWLARSVGFVLSTLATAGILVLAPAWGTMLRRWMPAVLAEAIAVPLAAQLACTPVIAAISGQVSLIAVVANVAAAPAVGPATVASLLAGLIAMVWPAAGQLAARVADLPLWWITWVAEHGARIAGASVPWAATTGSIIVLCGICLAAVAALGLMLPHRLPSLVAAGLLFGVLLHPPGPPGWPPAGWVMVMCDVGQGDALVLNAGSGSAVVVDTGPDPVAMSGCLRPLGIQRIPQVVLTHFHADHVDGLSAVIGRYPVDELELSPYDEPDDRYRTVLATARAAGVATSVAHPGQRGRVGALSWVVLGPPPGTATGIGDAGSAPNNASVVLLVRVAGLRILLAGDAEPEEEDAILAGGLDVRADVLKEPHHGSAGVDPAFLAAVGAAVSLISVGIDNPYGHPAPEALAELHDLRTAVYRTDRDGAIALVPDGDGLTVVTQR